MERRWGPRPRWPRSVPTTTGSSPTARPRLDCRSTPSSGHDGAASPSDGAWTGYGIIPSTDEAGVALPWHSLDRAPYWVSGPRLASTDAGPIETVTRSRSAPRGRDHLNAIGRHVETRWLPPSHVTTIDGFRDDDRPHVLRPVRGSRPRARPAAPVPRAANEAVVQRLPGPTRHDLHDGGRRALCPRPPWASWGAPRARAPEVLRTEARADEVRRRDDLVRAPRRWAPGPRAASGDLRAEGFVGTVDFAWRERRVVVEIDSSWHDGPLDLQADQGHDRQRLAAAG